MSGGTDERGTHFCWVQAMIIYCLKQADDGLWAVCRMRATMFQGLQLGPAMKLAREAAREEHLRVGEPTFVDLEAAVLGGRSIQAQPVSC